MSRKRARTSARISVARLARRLRANPRERASSYVTRALARGERGGGDTRREGERIRARRVRQLIVSSSDRYRRFSPSVSKCAVKLVVGGGGGMDEGEEGGVQRAVTYGHADFERRYVSRATSPPGVSRRRRAPSITADHG